MKARDGITTPIWSDQSKSLTFPEPTRDDQADVIVVGAGIAGVTCAYLLAKAGKRVLVVDEGPIGAGQTERTSAHLASIIDDRFFEIEKEHGTEIAKLAHESHAAAIDWIERVIADESIHCEFARIDAYLFNAPEQASDMLEKESAAAKRAGVADMAWSDGPGDGAPIGRAIRFGRQAVFHPMQYLRGLTYAAQSAGVVFRTGRRVIDASGRTKDAPPTVTFDNELKLTSQAIIVATNAPTPINDWLSIYLKQAAYRTYVIGLEIESTSVPNALYWDTQDPYHYVRLEQQADRTILLVGGEDHKAGQDGASDERFARLTDWARGLFAGVGKEVVRWSGQVCEPSDGLGVIGTAPTKGDDVYVITGDSGMGLTHGTLGALLITDLIFGRPNPWQKVYDPNRFMMNREAIAEDLNANAQYADYLTRGDIRSADELQPGQGGLLRRGLTKLAVYKDEQGQVHQCSAVCPHLKAIVQWNPAEKTWDCPAHGSHFDCRGKLLIGPAIDDLPPVEDSAS
ncbi:MAG: FAD-dependent oxidoreductase [Tepidisphaeraceae bacterium]